MNRKAWRTRRLMLWAGILALLILLLTPAGIWIVTRLFCRLAAGQGWQVEVSGHTGSLLTGFSLTGLSVAGEKAGMSASADRLEVAPWSYRIGLVRPEVRLTLSRTAGEEPREETTPAPPSRIPVSYLPGFDLVQGRLR